MVRPTPPERRPIGPDASGGLAAGNHRIKRLRRLITQRKARSEERAFVVEGPALVAEALRPGGSEPAPEVEGVYVESGMWAEVVELADVAGVPAHRVAPGVLESVLDTVHPQPIAAVIGRRAVSLADLDGVGPVVVMVDPRDPGNVGTLIRSAEAAGAAGVVLAGSAVDPTNPKVVRAAAGAALRMATVVDSDAQAVLDTLAGMGRTLLATVIDEGAEPYDLVDWTSAAVILGNETHGLPTALIERADQLITIPLAGPTESLNLAVAGSVLCFEALRQRRSDEQRQQQAQR